MRSYQLYIIAILFLGNASTTKAQTESNLSQNIASGLAEFRQDIFKRKADYVQRINDILATVDTSSMKAKQKEEIQKFIQIDVKAGGLSNSLDLYEQIPKDSPYRNKYVENYIANNQDYQIDKDLISEMTLTGVLTDKGKINPTKIEEIIKDFHFLDIENNDRVLVYKDYGGLYSMYLAYIHEGIDIMVHNYDLYGHYTALDRADRYPNINNGNSVEFMNNGNDSRLMIKKEQWDKIIIRDPTFAEQSPGYILRSFHDNISEGGFLYIYLNIKSSKSNCSKGLTEEKVLNMAKRADFKLIDKQEIGCQTFFKFQSIKE